MDPRHQKRVEVFQDLFASTFTQQKLDQSLADPKCQIIELLQALPQLDQEIQLVALERPLADINKVDLAILRLIMFQSKQTKTPKKVLVDEGIELAKQFGSENSSRFVNGALAKLLLESQK